MIEVQLRLYARTSGPEGDFHTQLQRVPVVGDEISHKDYTYEVTTVMFSTDGSVPYIVAKRP